MPLQTEIFEEFDEVKLATAYMADASETDRGAVFTKKEVVEFILDLSGYSKRKKLYLKRILEPSFGHGEFLAAIVGRLLTSFRRDFGTSPWTPEEVNLLFGAIRAVELHHGSIDEVGLKLSRLLREEGFSKKQIAAILSNWLVQGDYLFAKLKNDTFDFVVGNPPYLRQELIPDALLRAYRQRFTAMYDRADLYIAFYERSLELLRSGGVLGFICADRWIKNKYGGPLRQMISMNHHLQYFVPMDDLDAFNNEVSAYPAVTIVQKDSKGKTRTTKEAGEVSKIKNLSTKLKTKAISRGIEEVDLSDLGPSPWIMTKDAKVDLVRELENRCPLIEETGCKIGIGVATGADKIYIGKYEELDVEKERKLRLAQTKDLSNGEIQWRGFGIVNPFKEDGSLASFEDFPRMGAFFKDNMDRVKRRNVAKKNKANWYRTIDRIYPSLAERPKLLIPDIKGAAHIVYENQGLYPHHNLYYIISDRWDLRALRGILLSGLAYLFVSVYSTLMRGGFLRFQAQYLRRIRIPCWEMIEPSARRDLQRAGEEGDVQSCLDIVAGILDLNGTHRLELEKLQK